MDATYTAVKEGGETVDVVHPDMSDASAKTANNEKIVDQTHNGGFAVPKPKVDEVCMPSPIPVPASRHIVHDQSDAQSEKNSRPVRSTRTRQKLMENEIAN